MRVGLTGGIGSGKSTVCEIFAEQGVPIIDADVIARQVVEPGSEALQLISRTFGQGVLQADGSLDRGVLRSLAFSDDAQRLKLESILHPRIRETMLQAAARQTAAYCILAIPLLLESRLESIVQRVLVIDCSEEQQLARVTARDQRNRAETQRIIATQISRQKRLSAADDVIKNNADLNHLRDQVNALHQYYMNLSRN